MLKHIFNPKSIALIGASDKPKTVGRGIASNLIKTNSKIYFVNPNHNKVLNRKTYASILDIKEKVDLAIIAVPAKIVNSVVRQCATKKVKGVIVISSGFSEVGNTKDAEELRQIVTEANISLVGPNCLGIMNVQKSLNASFAPFVPRKGNIALLSQSGAILDAIIDISRNENYGFSKIVSFGNEEGLDLSDYINYLENDKDTKVIIMYLEGIKNGRKFLEVASRVSKTKPIVVLKSGKTELGKSAALTHTGSLAGNNRIYGSVFKQADIMEVDTLEELLDVAKVLSFNDRCKNGVGIITNGGGLGVLAVDALANENIKIPKLAKNTVNNLDVLKLKTKNNPLDILGDALSTKYEVAIKALLKQKNIHCLLVIQGLQIMTEPEKTAKIIVKLQKKYNKPIIVSFIGGDMFNKAINIIEKAKIANIKEVKRAAKIIKYLTYEKE